MARLVARLGMTRYEADEHYRIALKHLDDNKLEDAALSMDHAIEMYPRRAEYHAVRGYIRLQDGLPDEAGADFDQALAINPYEILANFGKGVIAYNHKDHEQALTYFINAWAADSNRPEILYYMALTHHRMRNNIEAKRFMSEAADQYEKSAQDDKEARKRMRDAEKWMSEFDKLITEQQKRDAAATQSTEDAS